MNRRRAATRAGAPTPHAREKRNGGSSLVDVMLAMAFISVGLLAMAGVLTEVSLLERVNQHRGVAYNAARARVEAMRNTAFEDVFATFNDDPLDDPGGVGTAPGALFPVSGLSAGLSGSNGLAVGRVHFPVSPTEPGVLLEAIEAPELGMPNGRDLNGDGVIDQLDHGGDYRILPVRVVVTWRNSTGTFELVFGTNLTER